MMENNRDVFSVLDVKAIPGYGANNQLLNFKQPFEEFEKGGMSGWIGALIKDIFDFFGTKGFVSDEVITKSSTMILAKYPKMQIGWFANWYLKWINGENGSAAPNMVTLLQKLNQSAFDIIDKKKDVYDWKWKFRLMDVLSFNADWLFGEPTPEEKQAAYWRKVRGKATLDDMYLQAYTMEGTIGENSWPYLIDKFKQWIEWKGKQLNHDIVWNKEEKDICHSANDVVKSLGNKMKIEDGK